MIATRTFTMADQAAFARVSGDANPMHMDELAARRTQAGAPVVHGVQALLWALDALTRSGVDLRGFSALKVRFDKFVYLDQPVSLRTAGEGAKLKIEVAAGDLLLLAANAHAGVSEPLADDLDLLGLADRATPATALEPSLDEMADQQGWLLPPAGAVAGIAALYPAACAALGPGRVLAIAQLSTIVGMVCPGLQSIFSGVSIQLGDLPTDREGLGFRCVRVHPRFRTVTVACAAQGLKAEISAAVRAEPVVTPGIEQVAALLQPGEFASRTALIIGGSRGLGAATAKIITAGGGKAVVTYAQGQAEAEALAAEIRAARGSDACKVLRYDAQAPAAPQLAALSGPITDVYYFATSRIMRQVTAVYDPAQFHKFLSIYVDGFHDLCRHLLADGGEGPLFVVYPSSIAVVERPKDMTDYAMAKAAGEVLAADLARAYPRLRIVTPRLPRILTDQTATIAAVEAEDATAIMLKIVRGQPIA